MKRVEPPLVVSLSLLVCIAAPRTAVAGAAAEPPADLKQCYLRVAMEKVNPDAMYLARELCDAVYKRREPQSIVTLDPKTKKCVEWWFDADGRYESGELYCALEPRGEGRLVFACETKDPRNDRFTWVELTRREQRYEKSGRRAGYDPGEFFAGMIGCLDHKAAITAEKR